MIIYFDPARHQTKKSKQPKRLSKHYFIYITVHSQLCPQVSGFETLRYWLMIDCMKPLKLAIHSNNLKLVTVA